jgi:DNA-binding transcriptional ArsR family regulator
MNRDPFTAIADPTRRQIIGSLKNKPLTINQIADNFSEITQQAISKQVKYLEQSGLVLIKQVGRERYCYLQLQELNEVNNWLLQYKEFWNEKFDSLDSYLKTKSTQTSL